MAEEDRPQADLNRAYDPTLGSDIRKRFTPSIHVRFSDDPARTEPLRKLYSVHQQVRRSATQLLRPVPRSPPALARVILFKPACSDLGEVPETYNTIIVGLAGQLRQARLILHVIAQAESAKMSSRER